MKSTKLLSLICAIIILLSSIATAYKRRTFEHKIGKAREDAGSNVSIFSKTLSKVTGKLHSQAVREAEENDNVVISPFSISVSLGMSLLGARENTAYEIERFTRWQWGAPRDMDIHHNFMRGPPQNNIDIHNIMRKMIKKVTDPSRGSEVNMTNAMFLDNGFHVAPAYKESIINNYLAEHQSLDFANNPDEASTRVNDWIYGASGLEDVIPDGTINSLTKMVLVNVVNFLGQWNVPFTAKTESLPFKPDFTDANAVQVDYLVKNKLPILYYRNSKLLDDVDVRATFFAIPYKGTASGEVVSYMVIAKPDSAQDLELINNNLGDILEKLKPVKISYGRSSWNEFKVDVKLPKFDVSQELDVKEVLQNEGVRDLFDVGECDLSGITNTPGNGLYVSDFLHKARVAIDAEGTTASAATLQTIAFRSARIPPGPITVDVPFFFGIYNAKVNAFIFTGVVNNPNN